MGYLTDIREQAIEAAAEALAIHQARGDLLKQGQVLCLQSRLLKCIGRVAESEAAAREAIDVLEQLPPGGQLAGAYAARADVAMLNDEEERRSRGALARLRWRNGLTTPRLWSRL
jgi:hypothetical protein